MDGIRINLFPMESRELLKQFYNFLKKYEFVKACRLAAEEKDVIK
jgi:hypothetical protein